MSEVAIVGIDIDGVIAKNPWRIWYWPFSAKPIRNRAIRLFLAIPCYIFRRPIPEAIQWIEGQREEGNQVLVVSGIYSIAGWLIKGWFKLWHIPFDTNDIYLRKNPFISQPLFKAKTISATGCILFIDDREDVIAAIAKQFLIDGFSEIKIFQNEIGYVVSIGDNCNERLKF